MKNKTPKKLPRYKFGGAKFDNAKSFTGNVLRASADNALSIIGLDNVIGEEDYKGKSAEKFGQITNITGGITKNLAPIATGIGGAVIGAGLGNPMLGAQLGYGLGKGVQNAAGTFNPEDEVGGNEAYMKSQGTANKIDTAGQMLGKTGMNAFGMMAPFMGMGQNTQQPVGFANGGMNFQPNAELEKQENTIAPNGEFTQYNGPSHEQGGIKTNLDAGEIVFSDKLKPKGSKKTFADLNKKFNTNKEDKLSEDKKSSNLQKLTAQLMKEAKMKQSLALYQEQESLKQSKLDGYAKRLGVSGDSYKYGGMKRFDNGGEGGIIDSEKQPLQMMDDEDPSGQFADNFKTDYNKNLYNQYQAAGPQHNYWKYAGQNEAFKDNSPASNSNPMKAEILKQLGLGMAQNVGNLYDLQRSNTVDKEVYNRVTPELMNYEPALRYNNVQGKVAANNIKNASVGNSSTYLQNRKDLAINQMMANANIMNNYDNQNVGIKNQAAYYNAGVGDRETIANMQNQAQARNLKGSAYSNIGQNIMGQYRDYQATKANKNMNNQLAQRDADYLKIIASKYPEILNDPEFAKLYK
jgi:hypothetical protein